MRISFPPVLEFVLFQVAWSRLITPALWTCGVPTELTVAPLWIFRVAPPSTKIDELPEEKPVLSGELKCHVEPEIVVVPASTPRNEIDPAPVPALRVRVLLVLLSFNPPGPL